MSNDHGPKNPGLLANTVALIGLIILAVIVIWGLLHLGSLSSSWLSSIFPSSSTSISITAPKSTTADTAFPLNWKFAPATAGTYAIVYQCVPGATLSRVTPSGSLSSIPCGSAFTLGDATSSVLLVPQLNATSTVSMPISIVFMPSTTAGKQARGSATVSVYAAAMPTPVITTTAPATTPTNTTSTYTPSSNTAPKYNGPADLAVRIISVNPGTPTSVTFDISNVGGAPTGTYYFTANLPTEDGYLYSSPAQASLNPGDHVSNTLSFSPIAGNGGTISIHVGNSTGANNYAQQWIGGNGYIGSSVPNSYYNPSGTPLEQWSYDHNQYNADTVYQNTYPTYDATYNPYNQNYQYTPGYGANPSYPTYYPQTNYGYGNDALYPPQPNNGYGQNYGYPYQY